MKTRLKFLFLISLIFCFSTQNFGQTSDINVPDKAMEQVVRRILTWYFKPRSEPKKICLSSRGIKKAWLPEIKNIDFQLIPDEELGQSGNVFFFTAPTLENGRYEIGFGYGEPDCSASGDTWYFRLSKQKTRLWKPVGAGFGSGCGTGDSNGSAK
ncbi:MAG TPA: hypothetical protein VGC76_20180 [Pyrinomonadaceae bacterium]|jgi:hypothetical protein